MLHPSASTLLLFAGLATLAWIAQTPREVGGRWGELAAGGAAFALVVAAHLLWLASGRPHVVRALASLLREPPADAEETDGADRPRSS